MMDQTNPTLGDARLDRLMAAAMAERAEDVYAAALSSHEMTERIASQPRFVWARQGARTGVRRTLAVLTVVALLLLVAVAAFVVGSRLGPQTSQLAVAAHVIEAVNARDAESLRTLLGEEEGVLEFPAIDTRGGGEGQIYMTNGYAPHEWMGMLDTNWGGMEAHLESCRAVGAATISCAVRTRWRTLQIEIGEAWTFEFEGVRVTRLEMLRVDPDPPDRLMPLALADLSAWEAWLRETHPAQADDLLVEDNGLFAHLYFRYDWTNPDAIGASISEYLETRR